MGVNSMAHSARDREPGLPGEGYSMSRRSAILFVLVAALSTSVASARPASPLGRYIVVLRDDAANPAAVAGQHAARFGARISHVYSHALKGYAASLPTALVRALLSDRNVAYIERDTVMQADTTQTGATWGIDRTDQRTLPLSGTYTYTRTGAGVTVYILDTGVRFSHQEFGGRATSGRDVVSGDNDSTDCHGHGTHVAGTAAGATYGIAKGASIVAVRVLDCNGSAPTSTVVAGIDWVTANHTAGQPAVANMSLSGGANTALDNAVRNSIADGISYTLAAGNGNILGMAQNACNVSPARVAEAMTISSIDKSDRRVSYAGIGNCVDWFAPGLNVVSAGNGSDSGTATMSGTSMAAPHAAGVAAQYLQTNTSASPAAVRQALFDLTTKNKVANARSVNNHLLFTNL
jgi:subtilisin family serine protease